MEERAMAATDRTIVWRKDDPLGSEVARVSLAPDRLTARGLAIGTDPEP